MLRGRLLSYFVQYEVLTGATKGSVFNVGYALPLLVFLPKLRNSEACDLRCGHHHRLALGNGTKVPGRRALAAACMHSAPPGSMRMYTKLEPRRKAPWVEISSNPAGGRTTRGTGAACCSPLCPWSTVGRLWPENSASPGLVPPSTS